MTQSSKRPVESDLHGQDTDKTGPVDHAEPSWFFDGNDQLDREELAERYRRLHPQPPPQMQHSAPIPRDSMAPGYRDLIAARRYGTARLALGPDHAIDDHPYSRSTLGHAKAPVRHSGDGFSLRKTYALAALAAALTGGTVGYAASQFEKISGKAQTYFAALDKSKPAPTTDRVIDAPASGIVVAKKPISMATLRVADVSGDLNSYIPLVLHAEPAILTQDLVLKLSGLPDSAYLTAGKKDRDNAWQLSLSDIAGVKLVVPNESRPGFDVSVAAFEAKTGELLSPIKEMSVAITNPAPKITPAAAPPATATLKFPDVALAGQPSAIPLPTAAKADVSLAGSDVRELLGKGDMLLKSGDLVTARQFYERAFAKGSAAGAFGVARTYDPTVFAALNVQGLKPDGKLAIEWYTRAAQAGNGEAQPAIANLQPLPQ
jgi:hypothetical protein